MEAVNTKNRINYISGMKAFMLLIIFLIHAGVRGNQISQRACDFLFVISGYLIAYKHLYASEDIRVFSYIKNKRVKFYPLYFICCIVCAVCFEEFNAFYINLKSGFISLGLNLALLQSWTQNPYTFNSVSWFLSSLLGVYFVAPFALKLFKKVKSKYGYVLLLAIVWLVRFLLEYFNGKLYYINSNHFPVFSILTSIGGMLLFPLSKDIKNNFIINSILEISLLAIVAWLAYVHVDDVCISIQILFVWAAFYIFILNNDVFSRFMELDIWNIFSQIQMEFYLLHQMVLRLISRTVLGNVLIIKILVSFAITYFMAVIYNIFLKKRLEHIMCIILRN